MDLPNHEDATETIEVSPGKWEKIPNFNASLTLELDKKIDETEIYTIEFRDAVAAEMQASLCRI
jgi:hypothetical protein